MNRSFINFNPEIQRYYWQDFTPSKTLLMPVLLGLIYLLVMLNSENLGPTALFLFFIITVLWGSKHASEAVPNEVRDQTWDWQRMSAMSPWQMTIGKLFGSTLYVWYGGAINLAVFLIASIGDGDAITSIQVLLLTILSAIGAHALSVLVSIYGNRKEKKKNRFQAWILILVVSSSFSGFFSAFMFTGTKMSVDIFTLSFFGIPISHMNSLLLQVIHLDAWLIYGIYRLMRTEQFYFNSPYAWLVFLIEMPFFSSGFLFTIPGITFDIYLMILFYLIASLAGLLIYLPALWDSIEVINMRRLMNKINEKDYAKAGHDFPIWATSFIVMFVFALLTLLMVVIIEEGHLKEFAKLEEAGNIKSQLLFFILSFTFFILRDLGILLFNAFSIRKNPESRTILYFFLLYVILPMIFSSATKSTESLSLFWPMNFNKESLANGNAITLLNVIIPLIEASLVWVGLSMYWKKLNEKVEQSIL